MNPRIPEGSIRSPLARRHAALRRALAMRIGARAAAACAAAVTIAVLSGAALGLGVGGAWTRLALLVFSCGAVLAGAVRGFLARSPRFDAYLERVEGRFPEVRSWKMGQRGRLRRGTRCVRPRHLARARPSGPERDGDEARGPAARVARAPSGAGTAGGGDGGPARPDPRCRHPRPAGGRALVGDAVRSVRRRAPDRAHGRTGLGQGLAGRLPHRLRPCFRHRARPAPAARRPEADRGRR